jgi:hypothetical protein
MCHPLHLNSRELASTAARLLPINIKKKTSEPNVNLLVLIDVIYNYKFYRSNILT